MNLYKIHCPDATRYAGSMAEARTKKQEIVDSFNVKKSEVAIDDYILSTKKNDIIVALNAISMTADRGDEV